MTLAKAGILKRHVQSRLPAQTPPPLTLNPASSPTPISPPATSPLLPSPWPLCAGPAVEIEKDTDRGSSNDGDDLEYGIQAQDYENQGPEMEDHEIRIGSPTLERKEGSEERERKQEEEEDDNQVQEDRIEKPVQAQRPVSFAHDEYNPRIPRSRRHLSGFDPDEFERGFKSATYNLEMICERMGLADESWEWERKQWRRERPWYRFPL